jgi:hypothetical protein
VSAEFSTADVLDDAGDLTARLLAPWAGVVWLTALPLRLLQAQLLAIGIELGAEAGNHGDALRALGMAAVAAVLLAAWGRSVFVRACTLGLRHAEVPAREALRVPAAALTAHFLLALVLELMAWALAITILGPLVAVVLAGLAAAVAAGQEKPGALAAVRALFLAFRPPSVVLGLAGAFLLAWVVAAINLGFLFLLGLWLARAIPGAELSAWDPLLSLYNPRYVLVLLFGAWVALEPAWLASWTSLVYRARSTETGEDLRLWLGRLRSEEAA